MKNVTPLPPEPLEIAQFVLMITTDGTVTARYRHKFEDNNVVEAACSATINFIVTLMNASFIEEHLVVPGEQGTLRVKEKLLQLAREHNEPRRQ